MGDFPDLDRFRDRARAELPDDRFEQLRGLDARALSGLAEGRIARDGLVRATDDGELRSGEGDDGLTIEGYGAVTNQVTEISSWEGDFEEEFLSGSFKRTARNQVPKMQFDHGFSQLLGSVPMGRWDSATEDDHGLALGPGRVFDNWATLPIRDAIASEEIRGMSIRFSVVREEWVDVDGTQIKDARELFDMIFWGENPERQPVRRRVKEAKVPEAGPVVWPAYEGTSVGLRGHGIEPAALTGIITIDLARLQDPAQQRQLARAVYLADTSSTRTIRSTSTDAQSTGLTPGAQPTIPSAAPTATPPGEHSTPEPASRLDIADRIRGRLREMSRK